MGATLLINKHPIKVELAPAPNSDTFAASVQLIKRLPKAPPPERIPAVLLDSTQLWSVPP